MVNSFSLISNNIDVNERVPTHITELPASVLVNIFSYLHPKDFRHVEYTCKFFYHGLTNARSRTNGPVKEIDFSELVWQEFRKRVLFHFNWLDAEGAQKPHRTNFVITGIFTLFLSRKSKIKNNNSFTFACKMTKKFDGLSKRFPLLAQFIKEEMTPLKLINVPESAVSKAYDLSLKKIEGDVLIYLCGIIRFQPDIETEFLVNLVSDAIEANVTKIAWLSFELLKTKLKPEQMEQIAVRSALKGNFDTLNTLIAFFTRLSTINGFISRLKARKEPILDSNFWHELGLILEKNGESNAAKAAFLQAVKLTPSPSVPLLFSLVKIHYGDREFKEADKLLETIRSVTNGHLNAIVYFYMASVKKELSLFKDADAFIQKALEIEGESASLDFFLMASEIKAFLIDKENANLYLTKALSGTSLLFINDWTRIGKIHFMLQQWAEAEEYYGKMKAIDPNSLTPKMWWDFALIKSYLENISDADDFYTRAIKEYCNSSVPQPAPAHPQPAAVNPPVANPVQNPQLQAIQQQLTQITQQISVLPGILQTINSQNAFLNQLRANILNIGQQQPQQPAPQQPPVQQAQPAPAPAVAAQPAPLNYANVPPTLLTEAALIKIRLKEWEEAEQYLKAAMAHATSDQIPGALFDVLYKQQKWEEAFKLLFDFVKNCQSKTIDFSPLMKRLVMGCQSLYNLPWRELKVLFNNLTISDPITKAMQGLVILHTANYAAADRVFTEVLAKLDGDVPQWIYVCASMTKAHLNQIEEALLLYKSAKLRSIQECDLLDLPFEISRLERMLGMATQYCVINPEMFSKKSFYTLYSMAKDELANKNAYLATQLFLGIVEHHFSNIKIPMHEFYLHAAEAIYLADQQSYYCAVSDDEDKYEGDIAALSPKYWGVSGMYLQNIQLIHFYVALMIIKESSVVDEDIIKLAHQFEAHKRWGEGFNWKRVYRFLSMYRFEPSFDSSNINLWLNYYCYLLQARIELNHSETLGLFKEFEKECQTFKDQFYSSDVCVLGIIISFLNSNYKESLRLYNEHIKVTHKDEELFDLLALIIYGSLGDKNGIHRTLEKLEKKHPTQALLYESKTYSIDNDDKIEKQEFAKIRAELAKDPELMNADVLRFHAKNSWFMARKYNKHKDQKSLSMMQNSAFNFIRNFMYVKRENNH